MCPKLYIFGYCLYLKDRHWCCWFTSWYCSLFFSLRDGYCVCIPSPLSLCLACPCTHGSILQTARQRIEQDDLILTALRRLILMKRFLKTGNYYVVILSLLLMCTCFRKVMCCVMPSAVCLSTATLQILCNRFRSGDSPPSCLFLHFNRMVLELK